MIPEENPAEWVYSPTETVVDKLRRRISRFVARRPGRLAFDRPIVSFAFDDAPVTALRDGARILEAAGARGTYYISAGLAGRDSPMGVYADLDEVDRVAAAGHEIGCHTFSHLDCGRAPPRAIEADAMGNVEALRARGLQVETFAYPYGEVSPAAKRVLGDRYRALRTVRAGMVKDACDLAGLPGVGIEGEAGEARAKAWLDRARAAKAWVILFTHDVRPDPSPWGCTPEALERLVKRAKADGFEVATVRDALALGQNPLPKGEGGARAA